MGATKNFTPPPDKPARLCQASPPLAMDLLVTQAWTTFDHVALLPCCVTPAAPILFFGNLPAYRASSLRVVTVALNPSHHEFPTEEPFQRFPLLKDNHGRKPERYLGAMSAYFREDPYREWFQSFEPLLDGLGASYYDGKSASTALHTEICSPVATDPTWSKLDKTYHKALEKDGGPLFHSLLEALRPQIVVLSVAKDHLKRIKFTPGTDWKTIHAFRDKKDGSPRRDGPYEIRARWYDVSQQPSLFVFGPARTKPLADLTNCRKKEAGGFILKEYRRNSRTAAC